jgi:hypothetical protein
MATAQARPGIVEELRHYWQGEGPLWKLFWVYGVLVSSLGGALLVGTVLHGAAAPSALVLPLAIALLYTGFILVSIWRSAFNIASDPLGIDREAWGWLARTLTFGWAINAAGGSLMLLQFALGY